MSPDFNYSEVPATFLHLFLAGGSQFSPQKLDVRAHSLIHIKIAVTSPDTGIELFPCIYLSGVAGQKVQHIEFLPG